MLQDQTVEEKYLTGTIDDQEIIRYFQDRRREAAKSEGAIYTPPWIVDAMISRAGITDPSLNIVEPSSGHGSFILPLIRYAQQTFELSWDSTARWFVAQVDCFDLDAQATSELRMIVSMLFQREGVDWVRPELLTNIQTADGLGADTGHYDIAIGNPPYIRTQNLEADYRDWIRTRFEIAKSGNIDIYYAFLDLYVSTVPRCVFIVPNGWIKATGARALRDKIFPRVSEVVDFKSRLVFPNARTYTCILSTDRAHQGPLGLRHDIDDPARLVEWCSLTGEEIHAAPRVAKSGLATLADPVFTVLRDDTTGEFTAELNGQSFEIEKEILRPLYKITKLSALADISRPDRFVIFPYKSMAGGDVIPEKELAAKFPKAYAYLSEAKQRLLARDKGKTEKYAAFYAYGRTQGLHDLSDRDVVLVPTMIGGASKPKRLDTRQVTQEHGSPLFVSGFAVTASQDARDLLMSDQFLDYVRKNGTPKPGASEPYYAISSKHVNAFLAAHPAQKPA